MNIFNFREKQVYSKRTINYSGFSSTDSQEATDKAAETNENQAGKPSGQYFQNLLYVIKFITL